MPTIGEREILHRGAKFDFERVTLTTEDGRSMTREVVRHLGAVTILPLFESPDGLRVVLIRNQRISLEAELWELPAGTLEPPEDPADFAARELEEETGYRAGSIAPLADFYSSPGMTDQLMHAFVATDLTPTRQRLEPDERIRVELLPVDETLGLIDSGRLKDAKSMLTLLLALRTGALHEPGSD